MKKLFLILALSIFATGCATVPKQSFNKEANKDVKSISLINSPLIEKVNVAMIHHPGGSFGLIGGIAAALDTSAKTTEHNTAIKAHKTDWNVYAQQQIKAQLEKNGYQVKLVNARKKDNKEMTYLEKYPAVTTDAILDYHFGVGHLATGATTPYVPTVILSARLSKTSDKSVIYEEQFDAGNPAAGGKAVMLGAGDKSYQNVATLNAKPAESVAELKKAINKVATRIGQDLRK